MFFFIQKLPNMILKKIFITFLFIFYLIPNVYSQNSNNFFSFGVGSFIQKAETSSEYSKSITMNLDWKPHKYVGSRLIVGFLDGFWLGTALTFNLVLPQKSETSSWFFVLTGSVPFLINLKANTKSFSIAPSAGGEILFSVSANKKYYIFVKPFEAYFSCLNWTAGVPFNTNLKIYYSSMLGIKVRI